MFIKANAYFEEKLKTFESVRFENRKKNRSTRTYDQVVVTDKFTHVRIIETMKFNCNPKLRDRRLYLSHSTQKRVKQTVLVLCPTSAGHIKSRS